MTKSVPYSNASSDMRAREDIKRVLVRFGCEEIDFADNYEKQEVLLYFKHRGREIQLRASAERVADLLPKAEEPKVVALPGALTRA